ncbi:MAG TPA: hypothetical protein VGT03_04310 [Candidatus Acidoferrales bacterium]|nr:hypothetical protein [Candidatus Acidoferrales bacterium]
MKLERIAFAVLLAAAAGLAAAPAGAQVTTTKPITVKIKTVKPQKPKLLTFKGEVLHMDAQAIIVRDPKDNLTVRTFSYAPELSKKLKELIDRGGYQYGDRVHVKYASGSAVAQEITGKASKPH